MTCYFFNLHECGTVLEDEEGRELPDLDTARATAVADARAIMCAEVAEGRLCLSCSIVVRDAAGQEVLTVPFKDALVLTEV